MKRWMLPFILVGLGAGSALSQPCGIRTEPLLPLTNPGGTPVACTRVGRAIDFDGEQLIVGCDGGAVICGRDASQSWSVRSELPPPSGMQMQDFGYSVAIGDAVAIVGGIRVIDLTHLGWGVAFYKRDSLGVWRYDSWLQRDPLVTSHYGTAISIHNGQIAILGSSIVDLFSHIAGQVNYTSTISFGSFGILTGVSIGRDWLMAFTDGFDFINGMRGFMYQRGGPSGWTYRGTIRPAALPEHSSGEYHASMDDDVIAISSPTYDVNGFGSEAVWIYRLINGEWGEEETILRPSDLAPRTRFGSSVAVSGGIIVVGGDQVDGRGAVFVFEHTSLGWLEKGRFFAADAPLPLRKLGASVTVGAGMAFIGAPTTTDKASGAVTGAVLPVRVDGSVLAFGSHPSDVDALPSDSVQFTAPAIGPGPLEFQWLRSGIEMVDGERFSGVHSDTLSITKTRPEDTALYSLRVTSPTCGTIQSREALLDLGDCLEIEQQPVSATIEPGALLELSCGVRSYFPVGYQWAYATGAPLIDDSRVTGTGTPTLRLAHTVPTDATGFRVTVFNVCGERVSHPAFVNFDSCVSIVEQPGDVLTFDGDDVHLMVLASSSQPLTYQWRTDLGPLVESARLRGVRTAELTILDAEPGDTQSYQCVVSCGYNQRTTLPAMLTVFNGACPGDANRDRRVDMVDIATVFQHWQTDYRPSTGPGDASYDGRVNFSDVTMVLGQFAQTCGP